MLNNTNINLLLENNFNSKARYLADLSPDIAVIEPLQGLEFINTGFSSDTFNIVSFKDLNTYISFETVDNIIKFYNKDNCPFAW